METSERFTLIELLVVVAIIAILASMLLPTIKKAMAKGQEIQCTSQVKQMGTGFTLYADQYDGYYPCSRTNSDVSGAYSSHAWWWNHVAPFVGYRNWKLGVNPTVNEPTIFRCPSAQKATPGMSSWYSDNVMGYGMSRYVPPAGTFGDWKDHNRTYPVVRLIEHPDTKMLVGDARWCALGGYSEFSADPVSDPGSYWKVDRVRHGYGMNILYCDGHVEKVGLPEVMQKVATNSLF